MEKKHGMLVALGKMMEQFAGGEVMKKVMKGSDSIFEKTDAKKKASWMKGAIERLDKLVDEATKFKIMENCDFNCAKMNKGAIEEAEARPEKFKTTDEFSGAEQKNLRKELGLLEKGMFCIITIHLNPMG